MSDDRLLEEHKNSWQSFVKLSVWSTAFVVVVLVLMAIFLL